MGFGFMKTEGGFRFDIFKSCKDEGVDLNQACKLVFDSGQNLTSIGNITKGTMKPEPGIAGFGMWLGSIPFFVAILVGWIFIIGSILSQNPVGHIAVFKDNKIGSSGLSVPKKGIRDKIRAAGRTFILSVADTQTIFVGAFLLSFAGKTKCSLTSYHFTVSVDQMMIATSSIAFSVALVRSYWRNPLTAALRLLLSVATFIGVAITIFRKANFAPDYPPWSHDSNSPVLMPVACLLRLDLRQKAESRMNLGDPDKWPVERKLFIPVAFAFLLAHLSIPIRFMESKSQARKVKLNEPLQPSKDNSWLLQMWNRFRKALEYVYWVFTLVPPSVASIWCWVRIFRARNWVNRSGWIERPNTEMLTWDSGQLVALGVFITVAINVLNELWKRDDKEARKDKEKAESSKHFDEDVENTQPGEWSHPYSTTTFASQPYNSGYESVPGHASDLEMAAARGL